MWNFLLLLGIYLPLVSLVTLVVYWKDKRAAANGRWRVPEKTLHLLSLAGGWPGAFLAQKWLRHKTQKRMYLLVFYLTAIINIAFLCLIGYIVFSR